MERSILRLMATLQKKSTPSFMVYGETGTFPLKIDIESRIISYWTNLIDFNTNRLSNMIYHILNTLNEMKSCKSKWLENIKSLLTTLWHNSLIRISTFREFRSQQFHEGHNLFANYLDEDVPAMFEASL